MPQDSNASRIRVLMREFAELDDAQRLPPDYPNNPYYMERYNELRAQRGARPYPLSDAARSA